MSESAERIRARPGMYIGDLRDGTGLRQLLWEVLGNSIDEHLAGRVRCIRVELRAHGSFVVDDDGPGLAPETALRALTELHVTPTLGAKALHIHLGNAGFGLAAVGALSARVDVETRRAGRRTHIRVERGVVTQGPADAGPADRGGTTITVVPDATIFASPAHAPRAIEDRLEQLLAFLPDLEIVLDRGPRAMRWPRGLADFVESRAREPLHPTAWSHQAIEGTVRVDIAVVFVRRDRGWLASFVNAEETLLGGVHRTALLQAICEVVPGVPGDVERVVAGAVGVLSPNVDYAGPSRDRLVTPAIGERVRREARTMLARFGVRHPDVLDAARFELRRA